ncbi:uncharacterized protein [Rutidosis leptorrhynchoides]|uniref:uncharacterized protein n=1 Tax=Rutidosis leptorrhynchoides TaxID=125765 RepID=UPI003A993FCB
MDTEMDYGHPVVLGMIRSESSGTGVGQINWDGAASTVAACWVRAPSGRVGDELQEINSLIRLVLIDSEKIDTWAWQFGYSGLFSTKKLISIIDAKLLSIGTNSCESLRKNLVPKKAEIFIWLLRKRRLHILSELDKRGIDLNSVLCPLCNDEIESLDHAFILCNHVYDIWVKVYNWGGLGNVANLSTSEAFLGDSNHLTSDIGKQIWQAVEWSCAYLICKNRNQKVFKNKSWNPPVALNEIQVKTFDWIAKRIKKKIEWHLWLADPRSAIS